MQRNKTKKDKIMGLDPARLSRYQVDSLIKRKKPMTQRKVRISLGTESYPVKAVLY
jgi:hypothetical protein